MGKRLGFYFKDDEIITKLAQEPNMSDFLHELLKEHYGNSIESLERRKNDYLTEIKLIDIKVKQIHNTKKKNELKEQISNKKLKKVKQYSNSLQKIKSMWSDGKISDINYFDLFDDGKLNIIKAKKYTK